MSFSERLSWATLTSLGLTLFYFITRTFDGFQMLVLESPALIRVIVTATIITVGGIVGFVILSSIIMGVLHKNADDDDEIEADERDVAIELRGEKVGYYLLSILLLGLIVQIFLADMIPDKALFGDQLSRGTAIITALCLIILISEFVKWLSIIVRYRIT